MDWLKREQGRYPIHPAVLMAMSESGLEILPEAIVMEHPHASQEFPDKIAYTQNPTKGERDIQTVCKMGSYLNRHFKDYLNGSDIERIVNVNRSTNSLEGITLLDTAEQITKTMCSRKLRCSSCMVGSDWIPNDHPYNVYDPSLGWGLVIKTDEDGYIVSRVLVNDKKYVRIYHTTEEIRCAMEYWLSSNGYTKSSSWEGMHLKDAGVYPYLDGGCQTVVEERDGTLLIGEVDDSAVCYLELSNTDGEASEIDHTGQIYLEGNWYDEDDLVTLEDDGEYCHRDEASHLDYTVDGEHICGYYRNSDVVYVRADRILCLDQHYVCLDGVNRFKGALSEDELAELEGN